MTQKLNRIDWSKKWTNSYAHERRDFLKESKLIVLDPKVNHALVEKRFIELSPTVQKALTYIDTSIL